MGAPVTLLQFRTAVRRAMDIENETTRFTDSEVNDYVNAGIKRLHTQILRLRGQGYNEIQGSFSFPTVYNQELYNLPAAFLEVTKVFVIINGFEHVLETYEQYDTNGMVEPVSWDQIINPVYRLVGGVIAGPSSTTVVQQISLRPRPADVWTVNINYIPSAVVLVSDTDFMDCVDGYEELAIGYAMEIVAYKQGDDARLQMALGRQQKAIDTIQGIQAYTNAQAPPKMTDVRGGALSNRYWRRRAWPLP